MVSLLENRWVFTF